MERCRSYARSYQALCKVARCIYCFLLYRRKCCRRRWMAIWRRWALACPEVEWHVTEFGIRRRLGRFYAWGASVVARIKYIESIRSFGYLKDFNQVKSKLIFQCICSQGYLLWYANTRARRHNEVFEYTVGTASHTNVNWAARIRNFERRLAMTRHLATTIEYRVLILNVIMLRRYCIQRRYSTFR